MFTWRQPTDVKPPEWFKANEWKETREKLIIFDQREAAVYYTHEAGLCTHDHVDLFTLSNMQLVGHSNEQASVCVRHLVIFTVQG